MRHWAILMVFVTGCSTAPIADLLDRFSPGKLEPAKMAPYGGVCGPQQVGGVLPGPGLAPTVPFSAGPPLPGSPVALPPGTGPQPAPLPPPDFGLTPPS